MLPLAILVQHILTKTELAFLYGSRKFTKQQARVLRYRINKKLEASKNSFDSNNQLLEQDSVVFGTSARLRMMKAPRR
jgi:hypothetical protein